MDIKGVVIGTLAGLALGFAIAWISKPDTEPKQNIPSRPRESADHPAERPTGPKAMYTGDDIDAARADERKKASEAAEKEIAKSRDEVRARDTRVGELQSSVAELKKQLDEAKRAAAEKPPEPKTGKDPLVKFGKYADQKEIREANYEDAADANRKIMAALDRILKARADGKEPDQADISEIQTQNGRLQDLALKILKKLPTHSPGNGEYTHPLNVGNLIAQALKAAGKPLSDSQLASIADLGNQYEADYDKAQAGYNESTLQLEMLIDEVDLKQHFYDGVVALLAPDQRDVIVDPLTHNRLQLDFYSPGLMLQINIAPIFEDSREGVRSQLVALCAKSWKQDASQLEGQGRTFDNWLADIGDYLNAVPLADAQAILTPDCIRCGRAQIKAMYELLASLRPEKDAAALMRRDVHICLPRVVVKK